MGINYYYKCACGCIFDYELGKYGCPNCCGDNVAELCSVDSVDPKKIQEAKLRALAVWLSEHCSVYADVGYNDDKQAVSVYFYGSFYIEDLQALAIKIQELWGE